MTYFRTTCIKPVVISREPEFEYGPRNEQVIFHRTGFTLTFYPGYVRDWLNWPTAEAYVNNWGGSEYWSIEAIDEEPNQ